MKMKTNVLINNNNNNNSTFIANNEMNSDLQQKGCTKVPKEIDLIFIKLPIKFSYIFFLLYITGNDRKMEHKPKEHNWFGFVPEIWPECKLNIEFPVKRRQKNQVKMSSNPLGCHSHVFYIQ